MQQASIDVSKFEVENGVSEYQIRLLLDDYVMRVPRGVGAGGCLCRRWTKAWASTPSMCVKTMRGVCIFGMNKKRNSALCSVKL